MKIWKYEIKLVPELQKIQMPFGSQVLDFQFQRGNLYVWVLCDDGNSCEARYFLLLGTGSVPAYVDFDSLKHIGTTQMGEFVWHLFGSIL